MKRVARDITLNWLASSMILPSSQRWRLLKMLGMRIQPSVINGRCFFGGTDIVIGRAVFINYGCFFDNLARIEIGDNCDLGPGVRLLTSSHGIGPSARRAGEVEGRPICVGAGTWIGSGALILGGVTIGPGSVIGAGAVVTSDCGANSLYVGVPAKYVRELSTGRRSTE